ncbi:hypothetical protein [Caulobacter sp. 17J65-9]|uniref:hypothetical protein n=1 Tax=Caulobacter sp. 17J65-9 TaxID=2709382 RepID=UPI0013C974BC|nr:hypothetical protein [Caulobacter sp. 17J65-9]NEX94905.1 hypothetical protein [Caulobacter sp. 17J65-9]
MVRIAKGFYRWRGLAEVIMRIAARLLTVVAPLLLAGCAATGQGRTTAVYSNVLFNDESGDASGYEMELRQDGSTATVLLVLCEGGCHGGASSPVVIDGDKASFLITRKMLSGGRMVEMDSARYVAQIAPDHVVLTSQDYGDEFEARLERVRRPRPGQTADLANYN